MAFWRAVDWQRPWLAPYRADGEAACAALDRGASVAEALNAGRAPIRFVAQGALPAGEAYEAFIRRSGDVPTRDNLHDLFNGLVWRRFPAVKARLNELQAAEIARDGIGAVRGPVRDALTLFDENALLWPAPEALVEALRGRDWHTLFVVRRGRWNEAAPIVFGHALLEKLCRPRHAITAHAWPLPPGDDPAQALLDGLDAEALRRKPFLPLPVLGIPGWWPPNEDAAFYDDAAVFRPPRARSTAAG